jgi:hypothetical protein
MQSGQQFNLDQPGLMKAGLIPVIVGAVGGLLWISFGLWSIASLAGWLVPIFGGVWYVMAKRKAGAMPAQMDGVVNGAIMGAVVGLVYSVVSLITAGIGLSSVGLGIFGIGAFGVGDIIVRVISGAVGGAVGAWVYSYLVSSGQIK